MASAHSLWAWRQAIPLASLRLTLLALAEFADHRGGIAIEKRELASMLRASTRTVRRHLARLERDGLIRVEPGHLKSGRQILNRYQLLIEENKLR